jgi:hypothetical protein
MMIDRTVPLMSPLCQLQWNLDQHDGIRRDYAPPAIENHQ